MKLCRPIRYLGWVCCLALLCGPPVFAQEDESQPFRAILELSGLGPQTLAELGDGPVYRDSDWQILLRVLSRLQQFGDQEPTAPFAAHLTHSPSKRATALPGEIVRVRGVVAAFEELTLPAKFAERYDWQSLYRCQLRLSTEAFSHEESQPEGKHVDRPGRNAGKPQNSNCDVATVLTSRVPQGWLTKERLREIVQIRGVIVQRSGDCHTPLILTDHMAWYPTDGVPTGQLLLARHGMDIALLDEVRHRRPFVKPEISREGEAFYAALRALEQVDQRELVDMARENVAHQTATWRAAQPELVRNYQRLKSQLISEHDASQRKLRQRELDAARDRLGLAAAVMQLGEAERSSVAPFFLQPRQEVGELVSFEGVARRAVRISVADLQTSDQPSATRPSLDAYYEIEIFTTDSQNLPIVCCLLQLPPGFPTGDEIREPVRVAAVFFKNWRYRSRKLTGTAGETGRQRQLYTPVVLGKSPTWLRQVATRSSRWALWGGVGFLVLLVALWIGMARLARSDSTARTALRHHEIIDL